MPGKQRKERLGFFIDGQPANSLEIIEHVGGDKLKAYIEEHHIENNHKIAINYLKSKLGEYLSAKEIYSITKINSHTLANWRRYGKVDAQQLNGIWYYSSRSLYNAVKSEKP